MGIRSCAAPPESAIGADLIRKADFGCAHRAPLSRPEITVTDAFHAIFAYRPGWVKAGLIARNRLAGACGLETSTDAEILHFDQRADYRLGEKIGGWPIHALNGTEIVAGRDNAHLDFRTSLLKVKDEQGAGLIVTTVCWTKNRFGRAYLAAVAPFHRVGVAALITRAVKAGRL